MKNYSFLLLLASLFVISCSNNDEVILDSKKTGSLKISSVVNDDINIITLRAVANVNNFYLTLEDENNAGNVTQGIFSEFPGGLIENIPAGSYKLTLTSHPDGFTPAFDDPSYEAVRTGITVAGNRTTDVALECKQSNAGLYFTYDASLEQLKIADIVPVVTQKGNAYTYEGEKKEAKGYFLPENAELKIKYGSSYISISGSESQVLEFGPEQLWNITLKAKREGSGLIISATVKVITDPTHEKIFELEIKEEPPVQEEGFVDVTIRSIGTDYANFYLKTKIGEEITACKHTLYKKEALDEMLKEGKTLEEIMFSNGQTFNKEVVGAINERYGFMTGFSGIDSKTEYSYVLMSDNVDGLRKAQRLDFTTL